MDTHYFTVGDIVDLVTPSTEHTGPFRVVKVAPVNLTIETEAGRRLRINRRGVVLSQRAFTSHAPEAPPVTVGTVVQYVATVKPPKWNYKPGQLFVALDIARGGKVKIAKLGGENGMYWRINDNNLRIVDADQLAWEGLDVD